MVQELCFGFYHLIAWIVATTKQKTSFGKMMSPTIAARNLVFLSCMLLDKFLEKTVKSTSEIADTSDETQYK
ncbi:hypothetical protein P5673_025024 [Acropora cervicornis]|uniref:Uncharacterized protein n=1 Tax=Acropora cervicornis TaxID=6130 RepID=A0AAD9Q2V7_ACRCE|nr:hypothetical protein P5673_025024 [Acropora cervicornis]